MPKIDVNFTYFSERKKIDTPAETIQGLMDELKLNREVFIVRKNGQIVPEPESLVDGDELEIIKVVSCG